MFGLGEQKKEGQGFDLEKDLTGPNKAQKLAEYRKFITGRIEELKASLREGEDKEAFAQSEILLNGYNAFNQVLERLAR